MNRFRSRVVLLVALAAVFAVSAAAQEGTIYKHEDGGIQFVAPPKWDAEADGDSLMISSPDETIAVIFFVLDAETLDAAAEALGQELGKILEDVKITKDAEPSKVNGLEMFTASGKGKSEGVLLDFAVMVVVAKKPVMIFAMAESESFEKDRELINNIFSSIAPIK